MSLPRPGWQYRLSRFVPVRMRTVYGVEIAGVANVERATWWQWRGHIWAHQRQLLLTF